MANFRWYTKPTQEIVNYLSHTLLISNLVESSKKGLQPKAKGNGKQQPHSAATGKKQWKVVCNYCKTPVIQQQIASKRKPLKARKMAITPTKETRKRPRMAVLKNVSKWKILTLTATTKTSSLTLKIFSSWNRADAARKRRRK